VLKSTTRHAAKYIIHEIRLPGRTDPYTYDVSEQIHVLDNLLTLKKAISPRPELLEAVPAEDYPSNEGR
jgi:hypothetical protein